MPAPTALQRRPEELAEAEATPLPQEEEDELLIDVTSAVSFATGLTTIPIPSEDDNEMHIDEDGRPRFTPTKIIDGPLRVETRKVPIPPHRMTPLKSTWPKIYPPLVEHLKLQVRMNIKNRAVELRSSKHTSDPGALQKGEDFVKAFSLGFDVDDAIALLRLDDLYIETFEIKDVKTLGGEHLGRAIGRIAGKDGKTKFAIENASRTRVVLADQKVHILGGFRNIHIAREAIVSLILGSPPGKNRRREDEANWILEGMLGIFIAYAMAFGDGVAEVTGTKSSTIPLKKSPRTYISI
ncbi:MAG: pre-rRNA-processing protein pno1 [Pycnora praestabilis]|nr:MAG: pre-rRNA-processing protein pno1 [Pycnora praestabilis]